MNISTPLCNGSASEQRDIIPILRSLKSKDANFIVYGAKKKDECFSTTEEEGISCHSSIIVRGTYFKAYLQKTISDCTKCPIWTYRYILVFWTTILCAGYSVLESQGWRPQKIRQSFSNGKKVRGYLVVSKPDERRWWLWKAFEEALLKDLQRKVWEVT